MSGSNTLLETPLSPFDTVWQTFSNGPCETPYSPSSIKALERLNQRLKKLKRKYPTLKELDFSPELKEILQTSKKEKHTSSLIRRAAALW